MCQQSGSLDYVVALDSNSKEIRVLKLKYDPIYNISKVVNYKVVDKNEDLHLSGNIYVDCKMTQNFMGVNSYTIGILGQYF